MRKKARKIASEKPQQERRKGERRGIGERRNAIRWEPDRPNRRKKRDRRKSATVSWDEVLYRRR